MRSTFAVRETVSLGIMGAPEVPPLCQETKSIGQQMLNATVGINGLNVGQTQIRYESSPSTQPKKHTPMISQKENKHKFGHIINFN